MAKRAKSQDGEARGFRAQVRSDISETYRSRKGFRQDLSDLYHFYLDGESREKLERMGPLHRWLAAGAWLFGSMLRKLSPGRRLAILAALVLFLVSATRYNVRNVEVEINMLPAGFLLLLLVIMLELKDKLLAKDEIAVARKVQLALLPSEPPRLPGWSFWLTTRPANDVGGDLVDALEPGEGRLGIALGDVAGKGLGAALLMAKLQATLRAIAPDGSDLGALAGRLNVILERDGLAHRFATLFDCELGGSNGEIRFVNAGHNPPYILGAASLTPLPANGIPLGVLGQASYQEESANLAPGQTLVIYSDGVTEAVDAAGMEFGEARLRDALGECRGLSAEDTGRRVLEVVDAFTAGRHPRDDLSLVVIARNGG